MQGTNPPEPTPPPSALENNEPEIIPGFCVNGQTIPAFREHFPWEVVRQPTRFECEQLAEEAADAVGIEDPKGLICGISDENLQRFIEYFVLALYLLGLTAIVYRFVKALATAPVRQ